MLRQQKQFKAVLTHTHEKHKQDMKRVDALLDNMAFLREIPLQENGNKCGT